ncbi:MAG: hypothetical protein KGJ86_09005 [Chloroflexota bacterium]|nr:hypothetical protein [Chloroflexota bacterium]
MSELTLSLAMGSNPRSEAVLRGAAKADGIDFITTPLHASELFWRQLRFREFDVSEMSLSSLLIAIGRGSRDWVGLPIFTTRRFFHTGIWVRLDARIERPQDLKGKRIGVPEYQQTAALWSRGVLQHEFGVAPQEMEWWMERAEERSHGGATGFQPPADVRLHFIPPEESIGSMLLEGKLDATLLYLRENNLVDRSTARLEDYPQLVRLLFPDPAAEGRRYYAKTNIFPINHGMVIRRPIVEQNPWVVLNIFNAFRTAKEQWLQRMREAVGTHVELGLLQPDAAEALREDPFPYGVASNQHVLETVCRYSYEQGLTPRQLRPEEVFPPNTLGL